MKITYKLMKINKENHFVNSVFLNHFYMRDK